MVFQPTSPIKTFQQTVAGVVPVARRSTPKPIKDMPSNRTSHALEKLRLKKRTSKVPSDAIVASNEIAAPESPAGPDVVDHKGKPDQEADQRIAQILTTSAITPEVEQDDEVAHQEVVSSTESSPTDPAYVPNQLADGGNLVQFSARTKPRRLPDAINSRLSTFAYQSFFDTSSESEDDEPVVARAQSVRIAKPSVIRSAIHQGDAGTLCNTMSSVSEQSTLVSVPRDCDSSGTIIVGMESDNTEQKRGGPEDALRMLEGVDTSVRQSTASTLNMHTIPEAAIELSDKVIRGGLRMHPVLMSDGESQRSDTASSPLPRTLTKKRVKIRPADLIVIHPKDDARPFRDSIVSTPYPKLDDCNEEADEEELGENEKVTALPQRSSTLKSARFDTDRFPSPDRPETLFFDLGLAGHPAISTTLEIKIADKNVYDDEMLFRQIRQTYRRKLIGTSRLAFRLIRTVSHVTVSPSLQYDFGTKEFMKHFNNPRLGRKRKTWVIWLRHHSSQQSSLQGQHPDSSKQPLSASLRSADRRLSVHSDSTSTFNFPYIPWLTLPRMPFFSKETATTMSNLPSQFSPTFGSEASNAAIKLEFHHEFSFWTLAFFYLWIMLWSISAVVLWVVFGVPGARPGDGGPSMSTIGFTNVMMWNAAAQARVLTGLVLGMTVALLGTMVEAGLIAGAYILL